MTFLDVVLPLNLGPLTYRCPHSLSEKAHPGAIVSVPLKNKTVKGIILGKSVQAPAAKAKDIQAVHEDLPALGPNMIALVKWMAEYYLTGEGLVIKSVLPKEAFARVRQRKTNLTGVKESLLSQVEVDEGIATQVADAAGGMSYRAFFLHPPSSAYEYSFLIKMLHRIRNGIILVPEVSVVSAIYPALSELLGDRLSVFHSELTGGQRSESLEKIVRGDSDIVLGTRSAVFAPLKKVSFIAVLQEHSGSFKQENIPSYNARDVAVMRGYFEKATVLLSSFCPSVESLFNCKTGKYILLKPAPREKRPRIRLIDMRNERLLKPYLSKAVVDAASKHSQDNGKVMFVLNRRGYSILQCADCGRIEECPTCRVPLVYHKQDTAFLKCHYCGHISPSLPQRCAGCKGYSLSLSTAGTQKIQEDLERLIEIKTLRIDSDRVKKKADLEGLIGSVLMRDHGIIIGTKLMTRRLRATEGFSMAAVLNTDFCLNIPDFRSAEKAYQEILAVADKVAGDGEVFIQTRMPQNYLFKFLKHYDYDSFFKEELHKRKALAYPPYSRLILIRFSGKGDLSKELSGILKKMDNEVEILGPFLSKDRQGKDEYKLLLKSSVRRKLHIAARLILDTLKDSKDVKAKADVDPLTI